MPKQSDDLENIVNAQSEQINRLTGDLGVMMEQVNTLVGRIQPAKTILKDSPSPPVYQPAPSTDPVQILQLMISSEERGAKRTMEMFERVGAVMGSMQDSLLKGMKLANEQRREHFQEFDELADRFTPEDEDEPDGLDGLGEAIDLGQKLREMMKNKGGSGPPTPPAPVSESHEG